MSTGQRTSLVLAFLLATFALAFAGPASAETVGPVVTLGPTTVVNGLAVVSGTLGEPLSGASLSVNGQPLALNAAGQFTGSVNVAGQSSLDFAVSNPLTGEVTRTTIPLSTDFIGLTGILSPTALSALRRVGAELNRPVGGFRILDQLPLTIGGSVLNKDELSSMRVNGIDVLGLIGPDGSFSVPIPGTSREVTITTIDRQGATNTITYPVTHSSTVNPPPPPVILPPATVLPTPLGPSVSAAGAVGLRITQVRYFTKVVRSKKRVRVLVTVKDTRGYRIRNATVTLRSLRPLYMVGRTRVKLSNKVGQVSFIMRLKPRALGKRLFVLASARTSSAKAQRKTSVGLPAKARRITARR